ncbi:helix-turn-helix transcriptional regulator [Bacillus sp. JJ722]|uniref:helix-turn-helix transcriptional regulator n=1 Tax=Bacillus sp. JJ722 TaxID=3122973 RepID=UPI002FFD6476
MRLKSNISKLINESKYKREYIRSYMGVSSLNTISNWCTGKSYPSIPDSFKLAKLLEVKVDDLYEWEEEE